MTIPSEPRDTDQAPAAHAAHSPGPQRSPEDAYGLPQGQHSTTSGGIQALRPQDYDAASPTPVDPSQSHIPDAVHLGKIPASFAKSLGCSLLDLPPELTEWICELVIANNPSVLVHHLPIRTRPGTPAISRVNNRLRRESLPFYFKITPFAATLGGRETNSSRLLRGALEWPVMLGCASLKQVRDFTIQGPLNPAYIGQNFDCTMNFQHGALDMQDLQQQQEGPFLRWSLKRAFLTITKGKTWQPTEQGLQTFLKVFAIGFNMEPSLLEQDAKLAELKERFPDIYPEDLEVDLSPVAAGSRANLRKVHHTWQKGSFIPPLYRYVG